MSSYVRDGRRRPRHLRVRDPQWCCVVLLVCVTCYAVLCGILLMVDDRARRLGFTVGCAVLRCVTWCSVVFRWSMVCADLDFCCRCFRRFFLPLRPPFLAACSMASISAASADMAGNASVRTLICCLFQTYRSHQLHSFSTWHALLFENINICLFVLYVICTTIHFSVWSFQIVFVDRPSVVVFFWW